MLDILVGVTNTRAWHEQNLQRNPEHYSAIRHFGSRFISVLQDCTGGQVLYNVATVDGQLVKYGCFNVDVLLAELREWNTLYLSGRLHKPVQIVKHHEEIAKANETNLGFAAAAALLLLPPKFSDMELFTQISGLSYSGDVRMGVVEHPQKVQRLVVPNLDRFQGLYGTALAQLPMQRKEDGWEQEDSAAARLMLYRAIAPGLRRRMGSSAGRGRRDGALTTRRTSCGREP